MAFTLKVNGTAHHYLCDLRRNGQAHPHPADRYQPAAILSDLLDERTQVLRGDRAYGRCRLRW
jgi:hypothetical protein